MYSNNRGPGPQSEWQVQFIAGAIVLAPIIYFTVCLLLKLLVFEDRGGFMEVSETITGVLFGAGVALAVTCAWAGYRIRDVVLSRLGGGLQAKMQAVTISMALAEVGAVFGVVLFLMSGNLLFSGVLMAIGLAGKILLFPSRRWLQGDQ